MSAIRQTKLGALYLLLFLICVGIVLLVFQTTFFICSDCQVQELLCYYCHVTCNLFVTYLASHLYVTLQEGNEGVWQTYITKLLLKQGEENLTGVFASKCAKLDLFCHFLSTVQKVGKENYFLTFT